MRIVDKEKFKKVQEEFIKSIPEIMEKKMKVQKQILTELRKINLDITPNKFV